MKIKKIIEVAAEPVYNLTVKKFHNFISSSGIVLKNCDALRYFCVNFTNPAKEIIKQVDLHYWSKTELEDFKPNGYQVKKTTRVSRR